MPAFGIDIGSAEDTDDNKYLSDMDEIDETFSVGFQLGKRMGKWSADKDRCTGGKISWPDKRFSGAIQGTRPRMASLNFFI